MGLADPSIPFIFIRGLKEARLRPLFLGFWLAMLFLLGGTTPVPKWLLGRAFEVLTFERFSLLASIMALPFVGLMAAELDGSPWTQGDLSRLAALPHFLLEWRLRGLFTTLCVTVPIALRK